MVAKIFRAVLTSILASFVLSSPAWATCSNTSLSGVYGFVGGGTNGSATVSLDQLTLVPSTGKFSGTQMTSTGGVFVTTSISGAYTVASNCSVTGTYTVGSKTQPFSGVVISNGKMLEADGKPTATIGGSLVAKGSPTCTNAGIAGTFGLQAKGSFVTGAPFTGPVILIGQLVFSVNASAQGVIIGHVAGSENGTILTFAGEPVTGSYSVSANCTGTATITPAGKPAFHYTFVVVNSGKELMAIETDAHTVVSGILDR